MPVSAPAPARAPARASSGAVRVVPLVTTRALGTLTYAPPADGDGPPVGTLVTVPLAGRTVRGVVVPDDGSAPHEGPLEPILAVEPRPPIPAVLVELALWIAAYYGSTPARALALVLPPKGKPRVEPWAFRTGAPLDGEKLTDNQRALLDALPMRATGQLPALRRLEARGLVALEDRQRRRPPGRP